MKMGFGDTIFPERSERQSKNVKKNAYTHVVCAMFEQGLRHMGQAKAEYVFAGFSVVRDAPVGIQERLRELN